MYSVSNSNLFLRFHNFQRSSPNRRSHYPVLHMNSHKFQQLILSDSSSPNRYSSNALAKIMINIFHILSTKLTSGASCSIGIGVQPVLTNKPKEHSHALSASRFFPLFVLKHS
ncbi:hypothetical protein ES288_D06G132100v1 [Gossypium darwinii]|uniref:Uncharacterized protein n=1 Tax=Gossypium darwinii TaxID=34276 RepID=A0A5D2C8P0_GOSDA|nr:hypothetical protein ES288_D06G132100v1 [Gossypium darwinii]